MKDLEQILKQLQLGNLTIEEAARQINASQTADLGFANVDLQRKARRGTSEVIYGASKTPEQIFKIAQTLIDHHQTPVLITRMSEEAAKFVGKGLNLNYDKTSQIGVIGEFPKPDGLGTVAVVTAGTSDLPVAEEAVQTLRFLGNKVVRVTDVGVAGIHRLLAKIDVLRSAQVIIAIAGMEGALASVVAGLVEVPVVAVPTSVGYGASFQGLAALLAMLNSCASGVSVVNIDNGFGAAFVASKINHTKLIAGE